MVRLLITGASRISITVEHELLGHILAVSVYTAVCIPGANMEGSSKPEEEVAPVHTPPGGSACKMTGEELKHNDVTLGQTTVTGS